MAPMPTVLDSHGAAHAWLVGRGCRRLVIDSRVVGDGDGFVAWPGHATDGRRHVGSALGRGAAACLVEADGVEAFGFDGEPRVAAVHGLKAAAGDIASRFLDEPSRRLDVIAVTGTNGKTSTTWWIAQALSALGRRAGVVGTLGWGEPPAAGGGARIPLVKTGLTTPDPIGLQTALADFAERGVEAVAIEASSIGIAEHRLAGTHVAVAVYTNFTQDHLDYHGDMAAYWKAKAELFAWPGLRAAVVNVDDAHGAKLAASLAEGRAEVWSVSQRGGARLVAAEVQLDGDAASFTVREAIVDRPSVEARIRAPIVGSYNVANLLAVVGVLRALGVPLAEAASACARVTPVPGRMERVGVASATSGKAEPAVIVDYAHTPDALEKALSALRPLATARGGELWVVFGCGGDRDPGKRPLMGAIARRLADRVVLTSDNPRSEAPDRILAQILAGVTGHDEVAVIENRDAAITHAVSRAAAVDVVLVAGKGHEDYQEAGGVRQPFSDTAHAASALAARAPMATLEALAALVPGSRLEGDPGTRVTRVHSDSRTLRPGDLFVALRGERFDANDFLAEAKANGAAAALAERDLAPTGLSGLRVEDARGALGTLAAGWRRRHALPLIAVTGSNGKTTVTQMTAAILRAWLGTAAFSTEGNFNNDVGLPLTLLRLRPHHRAGVVELGMNHPDEIARLAAIAAPTVALVNNAQREHLEFMGSVDAVARENGSVIAALGADGVAVFPADDAHAPTWRSIAGARRVFTFGDGDAGDVGGGAAWRGDHWSVAMRTPLGAVEFDLRIAGVHNVRNAFAAAAAAIAAGAQLAAVASGLAAFTPVRGRSDVRSVVIGGVRRTLVDDTYNANPDSARAAVDVLAALPAPRWLVLGDMGEVGDQGPALHREVGDYARARGIDVLWAAGAESASTAAPFAGARSFATADALLAALGEAPAFASVLVKGSRFMKMERVVTALLALHDAPPAAAEPRDAA